ncbi:MAG: PD-(D/E)XK nuclease family protein, partial [Asgard group archaeon]|nr:PD-(D/E)XK nuclease family protein [Asgard group archaeon]
CSQKFRIHRILNPLPSKAAFMKKRRSRTSYFIRDFGDKNLQGIIDHTFFETFHREYWQRITEPEPPDEITSNEIKLLFWLHQQKRFETDPDYWMPFCNELRLMTKRQRGSIDCLEMCVNGEGIRLIDYKAKPHTNDRLELIFYANLFNDYRLENEENDAFVYDIIEIGCYYYELGYDIICKITEQELVNFSDELKIIFENISKEKFDFDCYNQNCIYADICKIEKHKFY